MSNAIVCGPSIYEFEGIKFEIHSYCGPSPINSDGDVLEPDSKFWDMWDRFSKLSEDDKEACKINQGGCMVIGLDIFEPEVAT